MMHRHLPADGEFGDSSSGRSQVTENPYRQQPDRAFWRRSVTKDFKASSLLSSDVLITLHDRVMSAGSCFAANIIPFIETAGINYLRTELPHPLFADMPEHFNYRTFTAAYGNIYTARQLLQLLQRALNLFIPQEDRWRQDPFIYDPFRPALRYPARSDAEFDRLTRAHLDCVLSGFKSATVLVFTLGLTEAWVSTLDGAVYPACPGTVDGADGNSKVGEFSSDLHTFCNFSVSDVSKDLREFLSLIRVINPQLKVILSVSPVPLVATATSNHVLTATTYSKAVLRAAAGEITEEFPNVEYFPSYEIVTGPQACNEYFDSDRRSVSKLGIAAVMGVLLEACQLKDSSVEQLKDSSIENSTIEELETQNNIAPAHTSASLSKLLSEAECEEEFAEISARR